MRTLGIQPLPIDASSGAAASPPMQVGFVDDAVVAGMIAMGGGRRGSSSIHAGGELIWPDALDYAGWTPRRAGGRRRHHRAAAPAAAPEPGIASSYQGGPRWWMASTAGGVCGLILAALLLSLNHRLPDADGDAVATPSARPLPSTPPHASPATSPAPWGGDDAGTPPALIMRAEPH